MSLFINKARVEGRNDAIFYILGTLLAFLGGQMIGAIPLFYLMIKAGQFDMSTLSNPALLGISNNTMLALLLSIFAISFLFLWLFIRFVHKKRILVSYTAFNKIDWKKVLFAFCIWFLLSLIIEIISYFISPSNYTWNYNAAKFWPLLLISFTLLPIQTTFEELLFRSYLMQGIGMWKPYRIIPLVITSVSFGLLHIANPEVSEYGGITMISYIGIGFLLGMITLLSDSLEFAVGLHAANNIYSATIVTFKGSALSTDALFYTNTLQVNTGSNLVFILVMVAFYFIIHKKYKLLPLTCLWQRFEVPNRSRDSII